MRPATVAPAPAKKRTGLVIAIVIIALLLLCCAGGVAAALFVPAIRSMMPWASQSGTPSAPPESSAPPATDPAQDEAAIREATKIVNDFYGAINSGDLAAVQALVTEDTKAGIDGAAFEGWMTTAFEYTRGWIEGDTAYIIGREDNQAFGSGENGGVKFTLQRTGGAWLVQTWQPVDTTQVEGSDTTGSSTGIPGPLNDATARDVMTQILDARKVGAANIVRRLGSERFLRENEDPWLDGLDNSEYFSYSITTVKISGTTASVVVSETWPDGTVPTAYGLIEKDGAVLVDSWQP
ncbi:MAG: hypothetical protein Q7W16_08475 [Coriobacteriia bacterium]|nr:hypothetical protein [Coriobacteriia bacterium]